MIYALYIVLVMGAITFGSIALAMILHILNSI